MKKVVRLVSAISAGASLAWGIAKALRKGSKRDSGAAPWPAPASTTPPAAVTKPPEPKAPEPKAAEVKPEAEPAVEVEGNTAETVIKGVVIYDPAALLAFVNDTSADDFKEAGVKGKALSVLEGARPFATVEDLGATAGVGRRTLQALCAAAGS